MKNPMEIYRSVIRTDGGATILAVFSRLSVYDEKIISENEKKGKDSYPLEVWNQYSVYKFSIIGGGTSVTANMKPMTVEPILHKIRYLADRELERQLLGKTLNQGQNCPQSGQMPTFKMGKYAGKTPAQVILEEGEKPILEQREYLQKNLDRYPANKGMIRACDEAINLSRNGQLNASNAGKVTAQMVIYDGGWKPDIYHCKEINGKKYYSGNKIQIRYDESSKRPFVITISTVKAPIERETQPGNGGPGEKGEGAVRFITSEALPNSSVTKRFFLDPDSILECFTMMKCNKDSFYQSHFAKMYEIAWKAEMENKEAAVGYRPPVQQPIQPQPPTAPQAPRYPAQQQNGYQQISMSYGQGYGSAYAPPQGWPPQGAEYNQY